jgi:hypothetical protein
MAGVNIKQVEGGEVTTLNNDDGLEVDTGTTSVWIKWSSILTLIATWLTTLTGTWSNKTLTAPTIADFTNANHDHGDADDGGVIVSASDTVAGKVELATAAETTTGTDATRSVTPDGLAGSIFGIKAFAVEVFAAATALATGDGKKYIPIPAALAGFNIIRLHAILFAKSTSGTPTVQIARGRRADATSAHTFVDMLTTLITVDANEFDSRTAATAPVIDTANDDLADGDLLRVDVDVAGTAATGMWITFEAQLP